jgi:hypothetical protein
MAIDVTLSDGIKHIQWNPGGYVAVYYNTGAVDYFHNVSWSDFVAVTTAAIPSNAVKTNLSGKYRVTGGAHG